MHYRDEQWTVVGDSGANASASVQKAGQSGKRHFVTGFEVVVRDAAVGSSDVQILLEDGSTTRWKTYIGASAPRGERVGVIFAHPIRCGVGNTVKLTVGAAGTSVVTTLNLFGYSE